MNIEEAGEVLLKGEPWLTCDECKGRGRIPDPHVPVEVHRCGKCLGDHSLQNPVYWTAHNLLRPGTPYPTRPLTNAEKIVGMAADMLKKEMNTSALSRMKQLFDIKEGK